MFNLKKKNQNRQLVKISVTIRIEEEIKRPIKA